MALKLKISKERKSLNDTEKGHFLCKAFATVLEPKMCRYRRMYNSCNCKLDCEQWEIVDELFPQKLMLRRKK